MTRRRGEGSIRKVHCKCAGCVNCDGTCSHRNYWKAVWYCSGCDRHPVRGKHSKQFSSETAARIHLRDRLTAKASGEVEPGEHTFDELSEIWLAVKKAKRLKTKTIVGYQSILIHHLTPAFGEMPVRKITTAMVDAFIAEITRGSNTVRNVYRVLFSLMAYAQKIGWVSANPCAAELPKDEEEKVHTVLTPEELETLARASGSPTYEALIRFAGWTGMRSGELSALRVKHLNPLKGTVTVKRSVGKVEREFVEGPTKTYRERTMGVNKSAMQPVLDLIEGRGPEELVFINGNVDGGYLAPDQILNAVRKAAKVALPPAKQMVRVHDLRHTHASILIAYLGADVVTVSRRLGHRDPAITLKVYSHWFPERQEELVLAMEELAIQAGAA